MVPRYLTNSSEIIYPKSQGWLMFRLDFYCNRHIHYKVHDLRILHSHLMTCSDMHNTVTNIIAVYFRNGIPRNSLRFLVRISWRRTHVRHACQSSAPLITQPELMVSFMHRLGDSPKLWKFPTRTFGQVSCRPIQWLKPRRPKSKAISCSEGQVADSLGVLREAGTQTPTVSGGTAYAVYIPRLNTCAHTIFHKLWHFIARKIQMLYFNNTSKEIQQEGLAVASIAMGVARNFIFFWGGV